MLRWLGAMGKINTEFILWTPQLAILHRYSSHIPLLVIFTASVGALGDNQLPIFFRRKHKHGLGAYREVLAADRNGHVGK